MEIEGLIKVGIATRNLDAAASLLVQSFGMVPGEVARNRMFDMKLCVLTLDRFYVEVMEPIGPDGPIARFIEDHGEGLQHITVKVKDVERAVAELAGKGVRFTSTSPAVLDTVIGPMKFVFMHPKGCNGVLIQLAELKA